MELPDDGVWKRAKAEDAKCRAVFGPTWSMEQAADLFAILEAERLSATERAAKIAEERAEKYRQHNVRNDLAVVVESVAAAIRSQP
jgi:hypothetical protein